MIVSALNQNDPTFYYEQKFSSTSQLSKVAWSIRNSYPKNTSFENHLRARYFCKKKNKKKQYVSNNRSVTVNVRENRYFKWILERPRDFSEHVHVCIAGSTSTASFSLRPTRTKIYSKFLEDARQTCQILLQEVEIWNPKIARIRIRNFVNLRMEKDFEKLSEPKTSYERANVKGKLPCVYMLEVEILQILG